MTAEGSPSVRRVLVAGCGYVGGALAGMLSADGVEVWALKRHPSGLPPGVHPLAGDVTAPDTLTALPLHPDAVVYAVSPSERTPEAYRTAYVDGLLHVLEASGGSGRPFRGRLVLVSSTGAYGHTDGSWVDEDTPAQPADATAEALVEGEALARTFGGSGTVLRLGGIYGPGRDRTVRRVAQGEAPCPDPHRFGNRIHRDDAAAAVRHLLQLEEPAELYLGVDRDPAPLREVYRWIAGQLDVPDPCAGEDAEARAASSGRRGTNKRCSSDRLLASGFAFRYPTFMEGYAELIQALRD